MRIRDAAANDGALTVLGMKQELHALPTQGRQMADICIDIPSVAEIMITYDSMLHDKYLLIKGSISVYCKTHFSRASNFREFRE